MPWAFQQIHAILHLKPLWQVRNVNGQVFQIEKGRVYIYSETIEIRSLHKAEDNGLWSADEIAELAPAILLAGYVNPAPAKKD